MKTALVLPAPGVDPLLRSVGADYPHAVRDFPAHVTLLYPFLDPFLDPSKDGGEVDVRRQVHELAAAHPPMEVAFDAILRDPGFVALRADALRPLVTAARRRWPQLTPYDGRYGADPAPHLTVAVGAAEQEAGEIEARVRERLPVTAKLDQIWLATFAATWHVERRFPLTG